MSNPRKIKIIKRRTETFPPAIQPFKGTGTKAVSSGKAEREMTRQINRWIAEWREQRQIRESTALFYRKSLAAN